MHYFNCTINISKQVAITQASVHTILVWVLEYCIYLCIVLLCGISLIQSIHGNWQHMLFVITSSWYLLDWEYVSLVYCSEHYFSMLKWYACFSGNWLRICINFTSRCYLHSNSNVFAIGCCNVWWFKAHLHTFLFLK